MKKIVYVDQNFAKFIYFLLGILFCDLVVAFMKLGVIIYDFVDLGRGLFI